MAKYYIESNKIKVYPTAFRDISNSEDTQSYLNTEFNVTNPKYLSAIKENQSFSYKDGDDMVLSIHGYTFKFEESFVSSRNIVNAYICLQQKDVPTTGTAIYNNYILVADASGQGTYSTTLDAEDGGTYYFYGLVFTDEDIDSLIESSTSGTKYFGIKVKNGSSVYYQSLKLSTNEVRDDSDKSIDQEFTTLKLNATTINTNSITSMGSISSRGLSVEGLGTFDSLRVNNGINTNTITTSGNATIGSVLNAGSLNISGNINANSLSATTSINVNSIEATNISGTLTGDVKNSRGDVIVNSNASSNITFTGNLSGNASTASKLNNARTINGKSFDGSENITTTKWGATRNIKISDGTNYGSAVAVDGSTAYTLPLPTSITLSGNLSANEVSGTTLKENGTALSSKYLGINGQVQSDWSVTDTNSKAFIKNKPTIPIVNTGDLTICTKKGVDTQPTEEWVFNANSSSNVDVTIKLPKFVLSEDNKTLTIIEG